MIQKKKNATIIGVYGVHTYSSFLMQRVNSKKTISRTEYSTVFQRDKERIMHSNHFKLLKYKSQIFDVQKSLLRKNKLSHTLEVSEVAKIIGNHLHLNLDLIKAIALGHDLGQPPFGHIGERALHLASINKLKNILGEETFVGLTGFKHNLQSLHVVDQLELLSHHHTGLNLTFAVREGIAKHASCYVKTSDDQMMRTSNVNRDYISYDHLDMADITFHQPSITLEGQTVAIADKLVILIEDIKEALSLEYITFADLEKCQMLSYLDDIEVLFNTDKMFNENTKKMMIKGVLQGMLTVFTQNIVETSMARLSKMESFPQFQNKDDVYQEQIIMLSDVLCSQYNTLKSLIHHKLITSDAVKSSDQHIQHMMDVVFNDYYNKEHFMNIGLIDYQIHLQRIRVVCDEIVASSDESIIMTYHKIIKKV